MLVIFLICESRFIDKLSSSIGPWPYTSAKHKSKSTYCFKTFYEIEKFSDRRPITTHLSRFISQLFCNIIRHRGNFCATKLYLLKHFSVTITQKEYILVKFYEKLCICTYRMHLIVGVLFLLFTVSKQMLLMRAPQNFRAP